MVAYVLFLVLVLRLSIAAYASSMPTIERTADAKCPLPICRTQ